jgi:CRP/FNR family transcriptional regulator, nitrogen oxide reductase regulator
MRKSTGIRSNLSATAHTPPPQLLGGLATDQQELVLQSAESRKFRANRVIIRTGDPATSLFLLTHGRAKYYRVTKTGEEVLLWWLATGDSFGLGTLLALPVHYIGTAQAIDDCELLVWSRDRIRSLAATNERLAENLLHTILYYLAAYTDRVIGLATGTAEQRLAITLLQLSRRIGHVRPNGVELSIMNEDLAGLANVSAFTASRLLKEWERQGLVQKSRGKVCILSPEGLLID